MSYKKVGGLHFVRIGRFGFSWFMSRRTPSRFDVVLARVLASR